MSKVQTPKDLSENEVKKREESRQRKEDETQKKKEQYLEDRKRAEENREKAEAAAKALSKKKNSSNLSYHIMFAVLGGLCLYVIAMMFLNQAAPLNKVPVIDDKHIIEHNENNFWKRAENSFFEGATLADAKKLMNAGFASHQNLPRCTVDDSIVPPESFNYKTAFPNCVQDTVDMGKTCGASYAFVTAQTVAERNCIVNKASTVNKLSAQELLKCDIMNNGCKNGFLNVALDHVRSKGLVDEDCLPYKPEAEKCEGMCDSQIRTRIDNYCLLIGEEDIKRDIMKNGPAVSTIHTYIDFLTYKSGLYTKGDEVARFSGQHAVRIVGWGVDNENESNTKYWIIQNTWGKTWGEDGFAKIKFGQELFFDQYAYSIKLRPQQNLNVDNVNVKVDKEKKFEEENVTLDLEDETA